MWRRGQGTLEYVFLLAIMASAIIAMLVYVKRGFQGNLRNQAEQIGSSASYSPGNITAHNTENKRVTSRIEANTKTTTRYGNAHYPGPEIASLKADINTIKHDIWVLRLKANDLKLKIKYGGTTFTDPQLAALQQKVNALWQKTKDLKEQIKGLETEIPLLEVQASALREQIEALKQALAEPDLSWERREELERRLEDANNKLREIEVKIAADQAALAQAKADLEQTYQDIQALEEAIQKRILELTNEPRPPVTEMPLFQLTKELEDINKEISDKQDALNKKQKDLTTRWKVWQSAPKTIPDITKSVSVNEEEGAQEQHRQTDETLGALSGDRWQR